MSPARALAFLLLPAAAAFGGEDAWERLTLPNGIRVSLVRAPHASHQATFTLLPLGLLDDDAGRTQFAHLVEHLIVRSTDPEDLPAEEMLLNGETTSIALRLETIAPVAHWREALERHARWLAADTVDPGVLEREKCRIAEELRVTSEAGATHKWALAAWNQVVRHGASHVRVQGEMAAATPKEARAYLVERLRPGRAVHVVSVGPAPVEELAAAVKERFGSLPARPWRASSPSIPAAEVSAPGEREASWDLPGWHYLEWYPLPDRDALDRVAADALALVVNQRLQQRGGLAASGVTALAAADLVTPEGRWLYVTAALSGGEQSLLAAREGIDEALQDLYSLPEAPLLIQQMSSQLTWPDFGAVRKHLAGSPGLEWIEAQQAIFLLYAAENMGLELSSLGETYATLDKERLERFAAEVVRAPARASLLLRPRAEAPPTR